ncbi:MAG: phosphoglycerate mutase family protein [Treponema sp.]|nr:phosphoglycerate mutase family protein [Treponema sp.]
MNKKTIITVRHTESEHHVNDFSGGVSFWNLTELGKEQAFKVGKWLLENEKMDDFRMLVSDLPRTVQTAEEICKSLPLKFEKTKQLREIDLGEGNGILRSEYARIVSPKPEVYDPNHRSFPHAENDTELLARMKGVFDLILASDEDNFILVSHGGALLFFHMAIMGKSLDDMENAYPIGKAGSISKIVINEDGTCTVEYLNKEVF